MSSIKKNSYYSIVFILMIFMLFISIIISSTLGVANITFSQGMQILISKIPFADNLININNISETHKLIIFNIRLPRIILSALIGAGLSIVGCVFQAIFRNPMADPYVLGISSGSALGASIAIVTGITSMTFGIAGTTFFAFVGAIFTTVLVYFIAKTGTKLPTNTLLLAGVSVSFLFSSINSLIMIFNRDRVEQIVFWTMGSLSSATWKQVNFLFLLIIIGFILIMIYSRDLNLMLMGDEAASSLGAEVDFVKKFLLIVSSIIIASCVSVSGVIGFIGLIIPHITRMIVGPNHKTLLPFSTLGGAIFMIVCDTLSRILAPPAEIPVGAITALFGSPYFIYLLIENKKKVL